MPRNTEGFDDEEVTERPVRGRRDPAIQHELELGGALDAQDGDAGGEFGLVVGDQIIYKVVLMTPSPINSHDRWFTYGVSTSVQPSEEEADAFTRAVLVTHERVAQAIADMDEREAEAEAERRRRPITARGRE